MLFCYRSRSTRRSNPILAQRPSIFSPFQKSNGGLTSTRVKCIFTDFDGIDQFAQDAVPKYEDAIKAAENDGVRIRALVICHPHNPLGRCYTPEALVGLMQICNKYKIHLLLDEIYALSVYENGDGAAVKFRSILTLDVDRYIDPNYLHILYGMSKDTAGGGLRLGCIYTQNEQLLRALSVISPFHWPTSMSERIAALMLEDEIWMDDYLDKSRKRLANSSQMVRKLLDEEGIRYYAGSNAGLFLWINLLPSISKGSFVKDNYRDGWLYEDKMSGELIKNGVYLTNGREMNAEEPGWYRLIFAHDEKVLREGVKRSVLHLAEL